MVWSGVLRRTRHLVIAASLLAALAVLPTCGRPDAANTEDVEATGRAATQAMAALDRASDDLAAWLPLSTKELGGLLLTSPLAASRQIDADLLPKLDAYLAVADDALAKADAYQAHLKDPSIQSEIDTIRRRTGALHDLRRTLAGVRDDLARSDLTPDDLDRIASTLSAAGVRALTGN
jgi:hypothetical protein